MKESVYGFENNYEQQEALRKCRSSRKVNNTLENCKKQLIEDKKIQQK